jgi:hypothetical protein
MAEIMLIAFVRGVWCWRRVWSSVLGSGVAGQVLCCQPIVTNEPVKGCMNMLIGATYKDTDVTYPDNRCTRHTCPYPDVDWSQRCPQAVHRKLLWVTKVLGLTIISWVIFIF